LNCVTDKLVYDYSTLRLNFGCGNRNFLSMDFPMILSHDNFISAIFNHQASEAFVTDQDI